AQEVEQATIVALEIYKRGQGKYTRTVTFVAGVTVTALLARFVWQQLVSRDILLVVVYGVPVAVFAVGALVMFWVINRPRSADFMIATEGEMKKVSWSSKKEIIGGTKVVIATTLLLAALLRAVDLVFSLFFLRVGVLEAPS
ncbi:MAG: preprotein translocase subunit SecE, partial [Planctomycetota bacterium]